MSPSRTCSPATIPAGSLSWSQAPTYRAWPSVTMRTSVRSVTGAPSCSSRCTNPVTGVASSHAESVRRPSMTGGVTTARAVAVREAAAPGAGIWLATSSTGNGSPMSSASAANLCDIRDAKPGRGEAPAAAKSPRPLVKLPREQHQQPCRRDRSLPAALESQPVIHLQENDIRRRALKQRPGVVSEVDLAALQLRRPTASPDEKQRRAGVVLPAEHDIAAE